MEISENSRVWIYQSDRLFSETEKVEIERTLSDFTAQWQAHGYQLAAYGEVRYHRFIIMIVDESIAGATGCSIDKSVKLMQQIEQDFQVNLFDRFNVAFYDGDEIITKKREEFESLIIDGSVTEDTIVFNNLVQTKKELDSNWQIPFRKSWHARIFPNPVPQK